MSQAILEGLHTKLTAAGTFNTSVNSRVYQFPGPDNVKLPYLSWFQVVSNSNPTQTNETGHFVRIQLDLYGKRAQSPLDTQNGWEVLGDIEEELYDLLQKTDLTVSGHDRGRVRFVSRGVRSVEDDTLRITDEIIVEAMEFA